MDKKIVLDDQEEWLIKQPKKIISVKAIIKSTSEDVLIIKSSYKDSWQLPGGGVEKGESPEDGLVREVFEETGLNLLKEDFELKGTIYKQDEEMIFLIYQYTKQLEPGVGIKLQNEEVVDYKFCKVTMLTAKLSSYYADFFDMIKL